MRRLLTFPGGSRLFDCRQRDLEAALAGTLSVTSRPASAIHHDVALIRAAQGGDHDAFEQLVRLYGQSVLRLALNLLRSEEDARDAYQEAFLKAYRNLGTFRFDCSFHTWLYRIVTNVCLDHLRKRSVRKEDPAVVETAGGERDIFDAVEDSRTEADPERDLLRRELGKRIEDALNKLGPRERLVFELKHYQGLRLRVIGEMLSTSEETAKNCLYRATQKLRAALA
ncbi:MAG: sigma-70 family RNA polymerase sigma factor [Acidobacteria bacterium]|nr:sigma-70 family RNA polymerase sigma factor [Acidobacteriota bacterium]